MKNYRKTMVFFLSGVLGGVFFDAPPLRLVDSDVAAKVDARLAERHHAYLRDGKGRLLGSPKRHGHGPVKRLLAGFIACECGATFEAVKGRYVCSARRRKGATVCPQKTTFDVNTEPRSRAGSRQSQRGFPRLRSGWSSR